MEAPNCVRTLQASIGVWIFLLLFIEGMPYDFNKEGVRHIDSGARQHHLTSNETWVNYLNFLYLRFLLRKMGIIMELPCGVVRNTT